MYKRIHKFTIDNIKALTIIIIKKELEGLIREDISKYPVFNLVFNKPPLKRLCCIPIDS